MNARACVRAGDISSSSVHYQRFLVCADSARNTKRKNDGVLGCGSRITSITGCSAEAHLSIISHPGMRVPDVEPARTTLLAPSFLLRLELSLKHCHNKFDLGHAAPEHDLRSPSLVNKRTWGFLTETPLHGRRDKAARTTREGLVPGVDSTRALYL